MKIVNINDLKVIADACGDLKELYNSENLSLSFSKIEKESKPHKHIKTEEVYYILKGRAKLKIEEEVFLIKAGDVFSIPKDKYHSVVDVEEVIELVVVTNPGFDPKDLIY